MAITNHHLGFDGDDAAGIPLLETDTPTAVDRFLGATDDHRPDTAPSRAARDVVPTRQRRPVAWLRHVVDAYGRPRDDGLVDVPLSQAELSEASGRARNCGTVYAYLRTLTPVVERSREGIVVDLARLEELEREHECRRPGAAGGTPGPSFSTPRPAPASAALRLVRRGPSAPDAPPTPVEGRELANLLELLVRCQHQLVEVHRRLVELVGTRHALPLESEHSGAGSAPVPRDRSAKVREPRGTARDSADLAETDREVLPGQEVETSSLSRAAGTRELADRPRTEPDAAGHRDWADDDLDELVGPLAEACRRTGRPAITDRRGVLEALRPYGRRQVLFAVALVARQVRAGKSTAPFGLLVVKAREGDADYFPTDRPAVASTGLPPQPRAPGRPPREEEPDAEAEAAVAALEADPVRAAELAELDAAVRAAKGMSAGFAERIFRDPALLRGYRRHAWRERHPRP